MYLNKINRFKFIILYLIIYSINLNGQKKDTLTVLDLEFKPLICDVFLVTKPNEELKIGRTDDHGKLLYNATCAPGVTFKIKPSNKDYEEKDILCYEKKSVYYIPKIEQYKNLLSNAELYKFGNDDSSNYAIAALANLYLSKVNESNNAQESYKRKNLFYKYGSKFYNLNDSNNYPIGSYKNDELIEIMKVNLFKAKKVNNENEFYKGILKDSKLNRKVAWEKNSNTFRTVSHLLAQA